MQTIVHVTGFEEETLNNFKGSYIIAIIFAVNTRIVEKWDCTIEGAFASVSSNFFSFFIRSNLKELLKNLNNQKDVIK